ncbi:MAG: LCP family protein [Candidatus Saccharimonadales bacterium]
MDKSHRYRRPHHQAGHKNIDGFISPDRFKHPTGSIGFRDTDKKAVKPDIDHKIDDFSRPSGYHPANAIITSEAGSEISQPLLPDGPRRPIEHKKVKGTNKPPKRRRFFHRPKSWKKFFIKTLLILLALALIIGGYLAYKLYKTEKKVLTGGGHAAAICDGTIPLKDLHKEGDSRVNVLLVGVGGPGHDGPDLTDTVIIASIDTINDKIDLLSIPRDLWVMNSSGGSNKINAIYPFAKQASTAKKESEKDKAGLKVLDAKITQITGIDIHYNVIVDFKAFKDSVNAVGGVTVNVPETLYDPTIAWENNYNPIIAKKGIQKFSGAKALLYAKSRETSSDFARSERQRLLLVALKEKILTLGTFSNPVKVTNLLNSFGNNVYTDFDLGSFKCLYKQVSEIPSSSIKSLDMVKPPHDLLTTGPIANQSTVFPKAGLYDYSDIKLFVGSTLRDSELAKENANVMVLNGTNFVGLATKEANTLKMYGYNVGKVGDISTKNYQKTVLVDLRNGANKYTKYYLQNRLKVSASGKLPDSSINPGNADFVIILGTDAFNNL